VAEAPARAQQTEHFGPFLIDAREYDSTTVIEQALALYAAGQNADRIAVRAIRTEPQHEVLAGVYLRRELRLAAEALAELEMAGNWHVYWHAQKVSAKPTGQLLSGNQGTVATSGIAAYTTFIIDLDPRVGADPDAAVRLAYEVAEFLRRLGVPPGAILIQQSGRGAYVLVAIPPQPLTERHTIRDALRSLAKVLDNLGAAVAVDASVHDPPRILRIGGTTNRKPHANPATPAWILKPWEPGIHAPWSVIQKLAAPSRPKLRVVPGGRSRRFTSPSRPLRELFAYRGWIIRERSDGVCDVRCPWAERHTDGRVEAILYPPRESGGAGWVKCLHAHCQALRPADVYRAVLQGAAQ
jgi:hypothetical protein